MKKLSEYIDLLKNKFDKSTLFKRLLEGVSWTLIGNITGKFLQLLAFIFVARILGKEEYGQVGIVRSTINMFLVFSSVGMGVTATRYIAMYRSSNPFRAYKIYEFTFRFVLIIGVIVSALVFIFSDYIAAHQLNDANLNITLKIGALVLFLLTISSVQTGALNGFEQFKSVGIVTSTNGLILLVAVVLGAYFWGVNGVIVGLAIAGLTMVIQLYVSLKKNITNIKEEKELPRNEPLKISSIFYSFSLPAVLQGLVVIPVLWWAKTLLIKEGGYGEMALYDVAEQWYYLVLFIPNSLSTIILPLLTNVNYDGSKKQYGQLLKVNILINVGVTLVIASGIAVLSPLIYRFYGNGFTDYSPLLVLLITVVICSANNVLGQVIVSKGKMWVGFGVNALWGIWLIISTFIFVGKYDLGALGLAYALLVSYILHSIVQGFVAIKFSKSID